MLVSGSSRKRCQTAKRVSHDGIEFFTFNVRASRALTYRQLHDRIANDNVGLNFAYLLLAQRIHLAHLRVLQEDRPAFERSFDERQVQQAFGLKNVVQQVALLLLVLVLDYAELEASVDFGQPLHALTIDHKVDLEFAWISVQKQGAQRGADILVVGSR